jgi:protein phosphatase PTC6
LKSSLSSEKLALGWSPESNQPERDDPSSTQKKERQVALFGVYDGHGGNSVSTYLKENLAKLVESSTEEEEVRRVVEGYRALGGYLKRYRGGPLDRFRGGRKENEKLGERPLGLDEMCVLAFLKVRFSSSLTPSSPKTLPANSPSTKRQT